jgi:hypothetical protein
MYTTACRRKLERPSETGTASDISPEEWRLLLDQGLAALPPASPPPPGETYTTPPPPFLEAVLCCMPFSAQRVELPRAVRKLGIDAWLGRVLMRLRWVFECACVRVCVCGTEMMGGCWSRSRLLNWTMPSCIMQYPRQLHDGRGADLRVGGRRAGGAGADAALLRRHLRGRRGPPKPALALHPGGVHQDPALPQQERLCPVRLGLGLGSGLGLVHRIGWGVGRAVFVWWPHTHTPPHTTTHHTTQGGLEPRARAAVILKLACVDADERTKRTDRFVLLCASGFCAFALFIFCCALLECKMQCAKAIVTTTNWMTWDELIN